MEKLTSIFTKIIPLTKAIPLFLLLLGTASPLLSQDDDFQKDGIKIYLTTLSESYQFNRSFIVPIQNMDKLRSERTLKKIGVPSIAYFWQNSEKVTQEISLTLFYKDARRSDLFTESDDTIGISFSFLVFRRQQNAYASFRYEWNRTLLERPNWLFSLGGGLQINYLNGIETFSSSQLFPVNYHTLTSRLTLTPRVIFDVKGIAVDINAPLTFMRFGSSLLIEENPNLTVEERKTKGGDFDLFSLKNALQLRLGVVLYL